MANAGAHDAKCHQITWFVFSMLSMILVCRSAKGTNRASNFIQRVVQACSAALWRRTARGSMQGCFTALIWGKVLTYLCFALNQGWHKDGHLVRVWRWKTPNSTVTHIEAKRVSSYLQIHSTEKEFPCSVSVSLRHVSFLKTLPDVLLLHSSNQD